MKINSFLIFGFMFVLFIGTGCSRETEISEPRKPNVLFSIADDYGYHDLSSMGSDYYETPHLDRLAGESMIFTHGYAAACILVLLPLNSLGANQSFWRKSSPGPPSKGEIRASFEVLYHFHAIAFNWLQH